MDEGLTTESGSLPGEDGRCGGAADGIPEYKHRRKPIRARLRKTGVRGQKTKKKSKKIEADANYSFEKAGLV